MNLDDYKTIGTHWTAFYVNGNSKIYFDSLGVEHIPKEINNASIRYDNVGILLHWIYWFILKSLLDYTNLISLNDYEKNDKIILK